MNDHRHDKNSDLENKIHWHLRIISCKLAGLCREFAQKIKKVQRWAEDTLTAPAPPNSTLRGPFVNTRIFKRNAFMCPNLRKRSLSFSQPELSRPLTNAARTPCSKKPRLFKVEIFYCPTP